MGFSLEDLEVWTHFSWLPGFRMTDAVDALDPARKYGETVPCMLYCVHRDVRFF